MKQMLKPVQDTLSADIHAICPLAKEAINKLPKNLQPDRPSSVASENLNDPKMYHRVMAPQSMMKLADERKNFTKKY